MKHLLVVLLALSVLTGSVWPAGSVSAQEEPTGGTATEGESSSPPPAEAPQGEAPPTEEQYAAPPAEAPQGEASLNEAPPTEEQYAAPPAASPAPDEQAVAPAPVTEEPAQEPEAAPEAAQEPEAAPEAAPGPQAVPMPDPASPSAGQYAQEIPFPSEEPAAPEASEGPLPSEPQPAAPPQAEPSPGADDRTISPASHCGGGLFGPGPPEGTPCDAPASPPPPDDPDQYQYAPAPPATDPAPPSDGAVDPSEPQPSPGETPPNEPAPVEDPAPEPAADPEPAPLPESEPSNPEPQPGEPPAEEVPPGSFTYGVCEDDPQFCGIKGLDPSYGCQPVYAGGPDGSVHHYECAPAKSGAAPPAGADLPDGQYCSGILYYESPDSEGREAYTCEDPATDRVCAYDAATGEELYCGIDAGGGQVGNPQEEPCGEDACGLEDIPADFECTRHLDDQGKTFAYDCHKRDFKGPDGSQCFGLIRLDANGEPLSGGEVYECQETSPGPGSCRIYDEDFNYIRDCDHGGGGTVPPVAFDKSDDATDAIANSRNGSNGPKKQATSDRDPSAQRSSRDSNAEGRAPSGDPRPGGPLGSPAPEFAPAEQGKPNESPGAHGGDAGDSDAGDSDPGGSEPGDSEPGGGETGGPGGSAFVGGVFVEGAFVGAVLGEGGVSGEGGVLGEGGVSGGDAAPDTPADRTGAMSSSAATEEVVLASLIDLRTASEPTRAATPGEAVATLAGASDVAPSTPVNGLGSLGKRSLASASASLPSPAAAPVEDIVPSTAGMQADEEENNGLVDRPDARRVAFVGPDGGGLDAGSPPETEARFAGVSSPTAAAVALLAAAGAAAAAWRVRRRGAGR